MNTMRGVLNSFVVVLLIGALLAPAIEVSGETGNYNKLTEDQKIIHVLNRLGFGARPGDVAKVKALGLQKYIDQQLDPASIDDASLEVKVKNLEVFNLSTSELFAKYPNPGALLQMLARGRGH